MANRGALRVVNERTSPSMWCVPLSNWRASFERVPLANRGVINSLTSGVAISQVEWCRDRGLELNLGRDQYRALKGGWSEDGYQVQLKWMPRALIFIGWENQVENPTHDISVERFTRRSRKSTCWKVVNRPCSSTLTKETSAAPY